MGRVDSIARRFSIANVLDESAEAKSRWPILELEVADIRDHPANVAYSMDEEGICNLADSIKRDGLTDIPMVRRMPDGGYQMLSGHRRKAAYALLAKTDPAFRRMPCRIVDGVSDEQAVTLLHTANYFTRELNVVERAKATQALGLQIERMRAANPDLKGVPSADLKAAIIRNQTGKSVSASTIKRQEQTARQVEEDLTEDWRREALEGRLSDTDIANLASMERASQEEAFRKKEGAGLNKRQTSALIKGSSCAPPDTGKHLKQAVKALSKAEEAARSGANVDATLLAEATRLLRSLREAAGSI